MILQIAVIAEERRRQISFEDFGLADHFAVFRILPALREILALRNVDFGNDLRKVFVRIRRHELAARKRSAR